jgi:hypothetical protein
MTSKGYEQSFLKLLNLTLVFDLQYNFVLVRETIDIKY